MATYSEIALVSFGNVWLTSSTEATAPELELSHPSFQFTSELTFHWRNADFPSVETALGTAAWYYGLRQRGVTRLWLVKENRARSAVLAEDGKHELWVQSMELGDRDRSDRRIWLESFEGSLARRSLRPVRPSIGEAEQALRDAIVEARAVAWQSPDVLGNFARMFDAALRVGEGLEENDFGSHLLPVEGYLPEAHRLIGMAMGAHVFGGMGSWYDMGPGSADRNQFPRASERLGSALRMAELAATNSGLSADN